MSAGRHLNLPSPFLSRFSASPENEQCNGSFFLGRVAGSSQVRLFPVPIQIRSHESDSCPYLRPIALALESRTHCATRNSRTSSTRLWHRQTHSDFSK